MSGVPAISRIDRRPPYTFHHKDGPLDDIGSAKLWPEAVEPTRIVEYKGFKLRRTDRTQDISGPLQQVTSQKK